MGTEMVAFLESVLSGLDCLDCLAEKGENPKVSGRAVSTSVDVVVRRFDAYVSTRLANTAVVSCVRKLHHHSRHLPQPLTSSTVFVRAPWQVGGIKRVNVKKEWRSSSSSRSRRRRVSPVAIWCGSLHRMAHTTASWCLVG